MLPNLLSQLQMMELVFQVMLSDSKGLGLRLMRHGAALIGGTFNVRRNGQRGTIATCKVTVSNHNELNFLQ